MSKPAQSALQMWAWPVVLGVLSLAGLVLALFDDEGPLDVFAWFALGSVVVVCLWFGLLRQGGPRADPPTRAD